MQDKTIFELVREMEGNDERGVSNISKYVQFKMRENIEKIDAYLNSKHLTGEVDSKGREKPFFNIVNAAVNIYYRATDIDRKNISIRATKEADSISSFAQTLLLQQWMRKNGFGVFLNEWGRVLARYGSAVPKFVEKGGELYPSIVPWQNIICDPIDFENNIVIEKLWMTPAQLKKNKSYDKELVEKLLDQTTTRKTSEGMIKDSKDDYIPIYEAHGKLPLSYLTNEEKDEDTYVQQMHVMTFLATKDDSEFVDYDLYSGREAKSPYMITHLIKEDNRTQAIGAVEHLFEAQWMVNDNAKKIKDQLELASKQIFQSSDTRFVGQNATQSIDNGDILIHSPNEPLTRLANSPDITAMQASMSQWQGQGSQEVGISETMMGDTAPSGTAWRQVQALLQESHSLFELMTENKKLDLERMLTTFVIPHLKKKMDTTEEISEILESHQIKWIDARYVPNEVIRRVNSKKKDIVLNGGIYTPEMEMMDSMDATQEVQGELNQMGMQRFLKPSDIKSKTWKEQLKDLEWDLEIDTGGEVKDIQGALTTLSTLLSTSTDPNERRLIMNKILILSGTVSPIELSQMPQPMPMQQAQPTQPMQPEPLPAT